MNDKNGNHIGKQYHQNDTCGNSRIFVDNHIIIRTVNSRVIRLFQERSQIIQIKGKVRAKLVVPKDSSREELEKLALANDKIQTEIAGKDIIKVIAVPNKLVNIVVK